MEQEKKNTGFYKYSYVCFVLQTVFILCPLGPVWGPGREIPPDRTQYGFLYNFGELLNQNPKILLSALLSGQLYSYQVLPPGLVAFQSVLQKQWSLFACF